MGIESVCEFAECVVGSGAMDGGGSAAHEEGDADGLGGFGTGGSGVGSGPSVRGDAAVTALDHTDGQRDEFLGFSVERAWCERGFTQLAETFVCVGDDAA